MMYDGCFLPHDGDSGVWMCPDKLDTLPRSALLRLFQYMLVAFDCMKNNLQDERNVVKRCVFVESHETRALDVTYSLSETSADDTLHIVDLLQHCHTRVFHHDKCFRRTAFFASLVQRRSPIFQSGEFCRVTVFILWTRVKPERMPLLYIIGREKCECTDQRL